jgi:hypothetical protein
MIEPMLTAVTARVAALAWKIISTKLISDGDQPDLVLESPDGRQYVVEVKTGKGTTHFSEIAEVERIASRTGGTVGSDVTPILLTSHEVSPNLKDVADDVGVHIIEAHGNETEFADALAEYLKDQS